MKEIENSAVIWEQQMLGRHPEFKKAEMKHAVLRKLGRQCPEEAVNQPLEMEGVSTGFYLLEN